ncbi:MAG: protein-glutamate O-methyltransferase CheR [Candidatus Rokubacteria bacterium]|nr:protein-glutamate O-methyltransferase CheR [Candidatus Rokubacteria bacterium]
MIRADDLGPVELERLSLAVTRRSGIAFDAGRWPFLRTRVREFMTRAGVTSPRRWTDEVVASATVGGPLYAELEQALHVHETRFFRYPHHHRILRDTVLPEWLATAGPGARLRVLSVGCSTGEEPYSLAMTIAEAFREARRDAVEIVAIDVSPGALATATAAVYARSAIDDVPELWRTRYFRPTTNGVEVGLAIRALVRFFQHDIRREIYLGKFDVVVCCNVLLYFTDPVKERIVKRLTGVLQRGGHLFLGHAEGVALTDAFRARHVPSGIVHQRR